jgi:exodeoxyribonuclease V beta subunit
VSGPAAFDVCGPLPVGVTVLEASAGTGKTFTIAALAARFVAEGTPLEHLLLVTFTRMATGELRERVRERLVTAERGLARAAEGVRPPEYDDVLVLLASAPIDEIERRRRRLAAALADFDAATIATTHGFCQHMLSGLGVGGDVEADVTFIEDPTDLIDEVIDDLYVRKFWRRGDPPFDRAEAQRIGRIAVANPDAVLVPADADPDTDPAMRWRLAEVVRTEVEARKRRRKILTYDDLLTRLASTLRDQARGPAACARLRERYRVALVDEFQDTDSIQWEIMRRAFGEGGSTLVLIGDPKQAIYAFRGADVYAYLAASRAADTQATLGVNWRSDQPLIDAYDALLAGTKLGHEGIEYRTVRAADAHQAPRLRGAPHPAPLRMRIVDRTDGLVRLTPRGWMNEASGRKHIAADLAADVVALLSSGAETVARHRGGSEGSAERVRPGHLAVLVAKHRDAALVREALDAVDVPAVINGAGSVFGTAVARQWLALLQALERPASPTRVRAAALTMFLGRTAEQVATADDAAWEQVYERIHDWAGLLRSRGVASLLETITRAEGLPGRMLSRADGERELTDLRHIGQLLHLEATSEQLGVTALTAWLGRRIAEAREDTKNEDRSRRLESDSEAVQVLTIYASKGLEFPIVYCPFLWDASWIPEGDPPRYHDPAAGDRRTIDVGGERPGFGDGWRQYLAEERGEDLRLAYVALTRARHQAVVWWASSWDSRQSALARLLFPPDEGEPAVIELPAAPTEDDVIARLTAIAADVPGSISIECTTGSDGLRWAGVVASPAELKVRPFGRPLDERWRRTSYTALTAYVHEDHATSEPEDTGITDEELPAGPGLAGDGAVDADEARLRDVSLPLAAMPSGARIGSLVHSVLERVDFAAADLPGELATKLDEERGWVDDIGSAEAVVAGLQAAIETPLGPLADEVRLRDIGTADRLDELAFELPLVGGDAPTSELTMGAVARLLDEQLPSGDVLAGYGSRLRDPALGQHVRGYLTGSLDAVLRVRAGDGRPRFVVVDYKTNWLGDDGEPLSAWHYRPSALAAAMQRAHYPLQALLYAVALHRYLRWRLPGYDPERNLGGVLYLFLRGMTGADLPRVAGQPCGVFAWRPPPGLIVALSDLFDRGLAAA